MRATRLALALTLPATILAGGLPAMAQVRAFADPALIDRAVADFTGKTIGVPGGATRPVDRRLRLAPCRAPLALAWHGTRQTNVRVDCPDAGGWHLFVPVRADTDVATNSGAVSETPIVARGEPVTIQMHGSGFSVSTAGEAMEPGAQGAWIRVRPNGAKEPVRARIERPGLVSIPIS